MTSKLGGRPTKDATITDAFNQLKVGEVLTKKDIATAKRAARTEKLRQGEENRKRLIVLDRLAGKVAEETAKLGNVSEIKEELTEGVVDTSPEEDEKSAHKMLLDLRFAYRNSVGSGGKKGKQRLVELMENDTDFKFAVKELLKIESALMAAKIRKDGDGGGLGGGQQNFFVVLKGLEDEKKFLTTETDKTVDMKQIQRAMNPEENSYEPEEEVSQRDAPEQLQKSIEGQGI